MKIEKLYPECKDYIWGGEKLKESYGKVTDASPCAESWELSFHKDGPTKLSDGRLLMDATKKEAENNGCHIAELNVWAFNENAVEFYKNCGMKVQRMYMEYVLD